MTNGRGATNAHLGPHMPVTRLGSFVPDDDSDIDDGLGPLGGGVASSRSPGTDDALRHQAQAQLMLLLSILLVTLLISALMCWCRHADMVQVCACASARP